MSQSILKQAGAPAEPRSVQLGGVSHAEGAAVPAHGPAVSGGTAQGAQPRDGGASGRGGGAVRSAGLSGTMSALTPSWGEHNLKAEAKQLLNEAVLLPLIIPDFFSSVKCRCLVLSL